MVETEGDRLLEKLAALANPHRLRVMQTLYDKGPIYVSQLAREIGISRPLIHLHLKKLQDAGLVRSHMGTSSDGKALNFYEVAPFDLLLTPATIAEAARTLSADPKSSSPERTKP